jgi:hypothetical protein
MESGNSRETRQVRLYDEDAELLFRKARAEQVTRNRAVAIAEIVHEQLAQLRLDERAAERERGHGRQ